MLTKTKPLVAGTARGGFGDNRTTKVKTTLPSSPVEINRPLPHDPEAEQGVLQACFADPEAVDRVCKIINPSDFYSRGHAIIFERLVALRAGGRWFTPTTVLESFRNHPECERLETLILEMGPFITGGTGRHFAKIVKDFSIRRSLINAAVKLATDSFAVTPNINEIIDEFSTTVHELKSYGGANG